LAGIKHSTSHTQHRKPYAQKPFWQESNTAQATRNIVSPTHKSPFGRKSNTRKPILDKEAIRNKICARETYARKPFLKGSPTQGTTQGRPTQQYPMQGGPFRKEDLFARKPFPQGSPTQGTTQGSPTQQYPMQGSPLQGGPFRKDPFARKTFSQGMPFLQGSPTQQYPMQRSPLQGDPFRKEALRKEQRKGALRNNTLCKGAQCKGSPMQGSPFRKEALLKESFLSLIVYSPSNHHCNPHLRP